MWHSFRCPADLRAIAVLAALVTALIALTGIAQPVFREIETREEALAALEHAGARERASAVAYLSRTGLATDGPLLVKRLFDRSPLVRELAEQSVWQVWSRSGDAATDRLLHSGTAQMSAGRHPQAIETFTRVIRRKPDFAEGWNKRATAYFLAGDLAKSLADCAEVMKRNPQHFGALSGYGQIYLQLEEFDKALDYFKQALEVNPNMGGVEINIQTLEELLREKRRRTI